MTIFYRPVDRPSRRQPVDEFAGLDFWRGLRDIVIVSIGAAAVGALIALWATA